MNDRSTILPAVLIVIITSAPVFMMGFILGGKYAGDVVRQQAVDRGAAEYHPKTAKFRWIEPYDRGLCGDYITALIHPRRLDEPRRELRE